MLRTGAGPAAFNMAVDEALLLNVAKLGWPVLRFYAWSEPAASFGYFQRCTEVAKATPLRPLVRRPTGGGVVPHDCDWTYSVVLPPQHSWYHLKALESYRRVHDWIRTAFQKVGITTQLADASRSGAPGLCFVGAEKFDVIVSGRKVAGAAQRRTRDGLLIQGSIQPPPGVERNPWERAVCAWATQNWNVRWRDWEMLQRIRSDAEKLASEKYATRSYNERR